MRKKRVLFHSNFCLAKTGFGRYMKAILSHLYATDKYELGLFASGMPYYHPDYSRFPWKTYGALPTDQNEINQINKDPNMARMASYGSHNIDKVIQDFKPDVYIGVEDIWGFDGWDRKWWDKITCAIHTTLDSLPILPQAVEKAPKIKNYWVWSEFAEKALHALGHKHVKTVHGCIDIKQFYKLPVERKNELRKQFNIPIDAFIIGFVFRNQLRKSVPNLLEGYALWKSQNPSIKNTYLLLHTHFGEGWNITRLAEQYKVNKNEILTTYVCRKCANYIVDIFKGQDQNCPRCKTEKSMVTSNVQIGVTEDQLNEVYNLMSIYCHPFTSGGMEIPIYEAKLTELITLVTDYSCGEDACHKDAGSFPLDWSKYTEHGTEFIKASTLPSSIAKQFNKVYHLKPQDKIDMGRKAREWTIKGYGVESVGKQVEDFIDASPLLDYDFNFEETPKNPDAVIPQLSDDIEWLKFMYKEILHMEVTNEDSGLNYWITQIKNGAIRPPIEAYFRKVAVEENSKKKKLDLETLLNPNDIFRVCYVMPESIGDCFLSTALFKSIRNRYPRPNWVFYVATKPEYKTIFDANEYIDRVIDYIPEMDNLMLMEGAGKHKGYFDIIYQPYFATQRLLSYLHSGWDLIDFDNSEPRYIIPPAQSGIYPHYIWEKKLEDGKRQTNLNATKAFEILPK